MTEHDLYWLDNNIPASQRFDDNYFSRHDGREETQIVFLGGNNLPQRWQGVDDFIIAELGFGTGLNFFETCYQWLRHGSVNSELQYVSFEKYPIQKDDIIKSLSRWGELAPIVTQFLKSWPPRSGKNKIQIEGIDFTLFIGDARELINDWAGLADAWYLDGFNPAKNPELWEEDLLKRVFEKTNISGTFSTYTSASFVRRNLVSAGFQVKKVSGYHYKRERLQGIKE